MLKILGHLQSYWTLYVLVNAHLQYV